MLEREREREREREKGKSSVSKNLITRMNKETRSTKSEK